MNENKKPIEFIFGDDALSRIVAKEIVERNIIVYPTHIDCIPYEDSKLIVKKIRSMRRLACEMSRKKLSWTFADIWKPPIIIIDNDIYPSWYIREKMDDIMDEIVMKLKYNNTEDKNNVRV